MLRRRATSGSGRNGVEPKLIRYPFQCPSTLVDELNVGACDEIANRARHQNLAFFRESGDTSRDVNGDPLDVIALDLDLPGVHPAPDLKVEGPNSLHMLVAQRTARAGPSKVARNPSPRASPPCL